MEGGCACGTVRYRLKRRPLFVHACHCRRCQRETGSAFVMNALIEAEAVELTAGRTVEVLTPSDSGRGQLIYRCPDCQVALWSVYAGSGPLFRFVRIGALDDPDACPPDIHIFTGSKQPWVVLPEGVPAVPEYYDRREHWPAESLARRAAVLGR
jgi:hypothetical protein